MPILYLSKSPLQFSAEVRWPCHLNFIHEDFAEFLARPGSSTQSFGNPDEFNGFVKPPCRFKIGRRVTDEGDSRVGPREQMNWIDENVGSGDPRDDYPLRWVESIDGETVRARRVVPKYVHVRIPLQ